jgi:tubulin--tyrosine ligase-like protein 12
VEFDLIGEILKKMPKLKALWINGNPCILDEQHSSLAEYFIVSHYPNIEIYNSKFTKNTREWGLKYSTFGGNMELVDSTNHEDMLYIDISERNFGAMKENTDVMKSMKKCTLMILNGENFQTMGECNEFLLMIKEMPCLTHLEMDYYLLDLFWKIKDSVKRLNPVIRYINGYDIGFSQPKEEDEDIDAIIKNIWKVIGTYRIATTSNQMDTKPVIYLQDEVGTALGHSDEPNVMSKPFMFFPQNDPKGGCRTFNLIWPVKDIQSEEFLSANKLEGLSPEVQAVSQGLWDELEPDHFISQYKLH